MFYILNFKTHQFISRETFQEAIKAIDLYMELGIPENEIEIIDAYFEGSRFTVKEFKAQELE